MYQYKIGGRERSMGLGAYPPAHEGPPGGATAQARAVIGARLLDNRTKERGQARHDAARAITVEQVAKEFIAANKGE